MKKGAKTNFKTSEARDDFHAATELEPAPLKLLKTISLKDERNPLYDLTYTLPGKRFAIELTSPSQKNTSVNEDFFLQKRKNSTCSEIEVAMIRKSSRKQSEATEDAFSTRMNSNKSVTNPNDSKPGLMPPKAGEVLDCFDKDSCADWPYSSFDKRTSPKHNFQDRLGLLKELYTTMSNKDILYHGAIYMQNLVRKQKDYQRADESISTYFDNRKEQLSKLLDRL